MQLKKAKLEEEERLASAEQESVPESDSELADHDASLILPMLLNQSDTEAYYNNEVDERSQEYEGTHTDSANS